MSHVTVQHYCCGVYNYNDWKTSQYNDTTGQPVPDSCCALTAEDSGIYKNITRCKELAESTNAPADNGFLNTGVSVGQWSTNLVDGRQSI